MAAARTERNSKTARNQAIIGAAVLIAVVALVTVLLIVTHHSTASNLYPGTAANRAACSTIKKQGAWHGGATITTGPQGRISKSLWLDINAMVMAYQIGTSSEIRAATKVIRADCALVHVG